MPKTTNQFIFKAFSSVVIFISGITTFSFFSTFFPGLIAEGNFDPRLSAIISGLIGVVLFDLGVLVWLNTYLNGSETSEQRSVSLLMTIIDFTCSALASIAWLVLSAVGPMALTPTTNQSIAVASLVAVLIGVVFNFGASVVFQRFTQEAKEQVQEQNRRDILASAETKNSRILDDLVTKGLSEKFSEMAPEIAGIQSERMAKKFYEIETRGGQKQKRIEPGPTNSNKINYSYHISPNNSDESWLEEDRDSGK